jgi:hypothetical protein
LSINRIHRYENFVAVPNETIRDERLSFKARGILAYMLSHVDGWKADYLEISRHGKEGREAVMSALRELDDLGYRRVDRTRVDGRWHSEVHWYATPLDTGSR